MSVVQKLCKESKAVKAPTAVKRKVDACGSSGENADVANPNFGFGNQFQPMMHLPQYGWQGYPFQMPAPHFRGVQMGFCQWCLGQPEFDNSQHSNLSEKDPPEL